MRKVLNILLILFLTSFSFEASAVSPGGIIKLFKGMGKIFKKGADEIPDIGKKLEDLRGGNLKSGSKIDDALNTPSNIDNTSSIKFNEKDKDAFQIMDLELSASWPIIQKKFKTLVKKFHPDRNAGNKEFEDKLKKITLAYSHLKLIMIRK